MPAELQTWHAAIHRQARRVSLSAASTGSCEFVPELDEVTLLLESRPKGGFGEDDDVFLDVFGESTTLSWKNTYIQTLKQVLADETRW